MEEILSVAGAPSLQAENARVSQCCGHVCVRVRVKPGDTHTHTHTDAQTRAHSYSHGGLFQAPLPRIAAERRVRREADESERY